MVILSKQELLHVGCRCLVLCTVRGDFCTATFHCSNSQGISFAQSRSIDFTTDCCGLTDVARVESIQEKVQSALEDYCRTQKQYQVSLFGILVFHMNSSSEAGFVRQTESESVNTIFTTSEAWGMMILRAGNLSQIL